MKINMLYRQFYDQTGTELMIGGVETYITNLIRLFIEKGHTVIVYQFASRPFENNYMGATVIGVCPRNKLERMYKNRIRAMVRESYKYSDPKQDMLLFCTENDIINTKYKRVVAIQHGIGWDVHNLKDNSRLSRIKYWLTNSKRAFNEYYQFKKCSKIVCVDYNFVNWYRTIIHDEFFNYKVIPNFSALPAYRERNEQAKVSMIFARRFQKYRGTRIFAEAIRKVLANHKNSTVTIAGEGPEEKYLHDMLDEFESVKFTRFMPDESIKVHSNYDIAIVPSTASEGTSLSLIEAMAAGCAVVSTDIGGLTNIIIDGHNGIIVRPQEEELHQALEYLINSYDERKRLSLNGYKTIKDSFDQRAWSKKWIEVIEGL